MLLLANSDLGSFLGRNSNVHVIDIPSKQDAIFYMNVVDLIDTGVQGGLIKLFHHVLGI